MKLNRIVVATDFSDVSLVALEAAFNLELGADATLYLLHVLETPGGIDPIAGWVRPSHAELYEEAMDRLSSMVPENKQKEMRIEPCVVIGSPVREIARFAKEKEADMIVVGTHGRTGVARVLMGSTAESLLRESPCQVLVVKPHVASARVTRALDSSGQGFG
jgi:nucleotide-binding universal stress UspA family protein